MSFLKAPAGAGGVTGLGSSLGLNPTSLQTLGTAMNGIANVGGASPGYAAPAGQDVNNHLQLLDPNVLRAILAKFGGGQGPTMKVYQQ